MSWWNRFPKKLTVLAVGLAVQFLPLSEGAREEIRNLVIGFLVGQGLADFGKERRSAAQ